MRPKHRRRLREMAVLVLCGAAGTDVAGFASLLVDSTSAKRIVWVAAGLGFTVVMGVILGLKKDSAS